MTSQGPGLIRVMLSSCSLCIDKQPYYILQTYCLIIRYRLSRLNVHQIFSIIGQMICCLSASMSGLNTRQRKLRQSVPKLTHIKLYNILTLVKVWSLLKVLYDDKTHWLKQKIRALKAQTITGNNNIMDIFNHIQYLNRQMNIVDSMVVLEQDVQYISHVYDILLNNLSGLILQSQITPIHSQHSLVS